MRNDFRSKNAGKKGAANRQQGGFSLNTDIVIKI